MEINQDKPSKGAEQILLAQIKQEFTAPADAIEQYIELVAQYIAVSYTHLTLPTKA